MIYHCCQYLNQIIKYQIYLPIFPPTSLVHPWSKIPMSSYFILYEFLFLYLYTFIFWYNIQYIHIIINTIIQFDYDFSVWNLKIKYFNF